MMRTLFEHEYRDEIFTRITRLQAGAPGRWGKMNAEQMLVHLTQSMRMATGELAVKSKKVPIRFFPLKQLIIYWLPFPKGAPTAPELVAPADSGLLEENKRALTQAIDDLIAKKNALRSHHPVFGGMTQRAWGVLTYRHADHHLRQFGV